MKDKIYTLMAIRIQAETIELLDKENEDLLKENKKIKEQLENCYCNRTDCSSRIKDSKKYDSLVQKVEKQQKKFIEYLESEINELKLSWRDASCIPEEILQKYKEIIGGKEYCVEKDENANQINVPHICKYTILLNEYQNWLAKEKEVVYRDCGHTQKAITKCYDKLVYLRKIYKDDYDIG